jgi:hypothetical protein
MHGEHIGDAGQPQGARKALTKTFVASSSTGSRRLLPRARRDAPLRGICVDYDEQSRWRRAADGQILGRGPCRAGSALRDEMSPTRGGWVYTAPARACASVRVGFGQRPSG